MYCSTKFFNFGLILLGVYCQTVFTFNMDVPILLVPKSCSDIKHCPKESTCIQGICFWNACIAPEHEKSLHYHDLHWNPDKPKDKLGLIGLPQNRQLCNENCVFPFEYNGKLHHSCIKDNSHFFWCSKTQKYTGVKTQCDQHCEDLKNAHLPLLEDYLYNSDPYYHGIRDDDDPHLMKSHHPDETYKKKISHHETHKSTTSKEAPKPTPMSSSITKASSLGHNNPESIASNVGRYAKCNPYCVFPFEYYGKIYNECIKMSGSEKYWCSFTSVYIGIDIPCDINCLNKHNVSDNDNPHHDNNMSSSSLSTLLAALNRYRNKEITKELPLFLVHNNSDLNNSTPIMDIPPDDIFFNIESNINSQLDQTNETYAVTQSYYRELTAPSSIKSESDDPTTISIKDILSRILLNRGDTSSHENQKSVTKPVSDEESTTDNLTLTTENHQYLASSSISNSSPGIYLKLTTSTEYPFGHKVINEIDSTVARRYIDSSLHLIPNSVDIHSINPEYEKTTPSSDMQSQGISETFNVPHSQNLMNNTTPIFPKNESDVLLTNTQLKPFQNKEPLIPSSNSKDIQNPTQMHEQQTTKSSSSEKNYPEINQRSILLNNIIDKSTTNLYEIPETESSPYSKNTDMGLQDELKMDDSKTNEIQSKPQEQVSKITTSITSDNSEVGHNYLETTAASFTRNQMENHISKSTSPSLDSTYISIQTDSSSLFNPQNIQIVDTTPKFMQESSLQKTDQKTESTVHDSLENHSVMEASTVSNSNKINPKSTSEDLDMKNINSPGTSNTPFLQNLLEHNDSTLSVQSKLGDSRKDIPFRALQTQGSTLFNFNSKDIQSTTPKGDVQNVESNIDSPKGSGFATKDNSIRVSTDNILITPNKVTMEPNFRPCDHKDSSTPFLSTTTLINPLNSELSTINEKFSSLSYKYTNNLGQMKIISTTLNTSPSSTESIVTPDKRIQSTSKPLTQTSLTPESKKRANSFRSGQMDFNNIMWLEELLDSDNESEVATTTTSTIWTSENSQETEEYTTAKASPEDESVEPSSRLSTSITRTKSTANEPTTNKIETNTNHSKSNPSTESNSPNKESTKDASRLTTTSDIITTGSKVELSNDEEESIISTTTSFNAILMEEITTLTTFEEPNESFSSTQKQRGAHSLFEITDVPTVPLNFHHKTTTIPKTNKVTNKYTDRITPELSTTPHRAPTQKLKSSTSIMNSPKTESSLMDQLLETLPHATTILKPEMIKSSTRKSTTTLSSTTTTTTMATTLKTTEVVSKLKCPLKNGDGHCIFPFHYKGKVYFTCTKQNYNAYWCGKVYTTTNQVWGYCSDECPRD
ncbi:unnamed protein product [Lepeophtheirus salmonis]|uniref:(salmon louse) hypothetical protein n=1 Tax=Lepeophtheirus salmonis TaxID=72036 RepID=A0A7R8CRK8_LEPSM|nr:unnamed protein product [Lepeophtheirus salmonis]CAF2855376.1 unnamed protein product [Lepeophtheirus salmonis]